MFGKLLAAAAGATLLLSSPAQAVVFGILGPGTSGAQNAVTNAGHSSVVLSDLSSSDLAGIDVLWLLNADNIEQPNVFVDNVAEVDDFVFGGGVFLYHDRQVMDASTTVPGGASISFVRDFSDDANIQVVQPASLVANGPGGIIDDSVLDGGSSSNHGYFDAVTLPTGAAGVLSRASGTEFVDGVYAHGLGMVYYSTIPLDHYLTSSAGTFPPGSFFRNQYATNVAACTGDLASGGDCGLVFSTVREPSLIALAGAGMVGLGLVRRRR